jgi:cytochrome c
MDANVLRRFGTDYAHPVLCAHTAFDVAAFIDGQPGRTDSATNGIFPTARSSPAARPIRRSSARSRHRSI